MPYSIEYYNERVLAEIEAWPVGILADYADRRAPCPGEEDAGDLTTRS